MEGGGEDLSPSLITPLIACQVLTQQYSRPLPSSCPSAPHPPLRHAHLQAIWLVTPIKRCRAEEPLGLLKDGAVIWSHWGGAQALQGGFDLSRLNDGPGVDASVTGRLGPDKCSVTFSSLQRPPMCDLREVY